MDILTCEMESDKANKDAAIEVYQETSANILKAYSHNKEALRLHERGFYKAAKQQAEHAHGHSIKAMNSIGRVMELTEKLDSKVTSESILKGNKS